MRAIAFALSLTMLLVQADKPKTYEPTEHQADQLKIKQLERANAIQTANQYCGSAGQAGSLINEAQNRMNALTSYAQEVCKEQGWKCPEEVAFNDQTLKFAPVQKPVETKPK